MVKSSRNSKNSGGKQQSVRIVGGRWRGSKLPVVGADGLRPTSDRVRETLFNWLAADIAGARCIDLFAGSGALGLEALSRGAQHVCAVEKDALACRQLQANAERLKADGYSLHRDDAFAFFAAYKQPVDILFLDPPFDLQAWVQLSTLVEQSRCFGSGALIYLEQPKKNEPWPAPLGWRCHKSRIAGDVRFELYVCESASYVRESVAEAGEG